MNGKQTKAKKKASRKNSRICKFIKQKNYE